MSQLLWTQKQDIGTGPRSSAAMTFDSTKQRVVLFGGLVANSPVNDTWEWDGQNWTQFADIGPKPRSDHAVAYDSARQRVVLFGGVTKSGSADTWLNDTWEWDGVEWTQMEDTGPAPRGGMAMCFDSLRSRVVLFGGNNASMQFRDTWVWDGVSWTQEDDGGPSARTKHGMDYDSIRDRVVLFGGASVTTQQIQTWVSGGLFSSGHYETQTINTWKFLNDTWEYDGTTWTRVGDTGPSPRYRFGLVYGAQTVLLFGGKDAGNAFRDTWEWDGVHWTQRQDIGPAARGDLAAAYDSARGHMVIFGGSDTGSPANVFGDTWESFERP